VLQGEKIVSNKNRGNLPKSEEAWLRGLTGKSLSEALIFASTNPKYDKRLFIDLPILFKKTTSSEHVVYVNCFEC
jgi:hypothetical protein